jgi:hypothetical protein
MCNKCFNVEIKVFATYADFDQFDLELTKKMANDKSVIMTEFVKTSREDRGYQIYESPCCGQLWKLSEPDYSYRGYFPRLTK